MLHSSTDYFAIESNGKFARKYSLVVLFCLVSTFLCAQGIYNNGAKIVLKDDAKIYIDGPAGNYKSELGGIFQNNLFNGTVSLTGNWINNAENTGFSNIGSTVNLVGTNQILDGLNSIRFYKLNATGAGTKLINVNTEISNLLTLGNSVVLNSQDKLLLSATATSNANVAAIPSSSKVSGNVTVQVYFTGKNDHNYRATRAFSSPVTEAVSTTYEQLKNYMVITGKKDGGFDPGGSAAPYATSLNRYNEGATLSQSQFTPVASISEQLSPGNGAFLFYRGGRNGYTPETASSSLKVNVPFMEPEDVTMRYFGPINQQNITVNVPYTPNGEINYDGYSLIGNPYPAVISWELLTKNNMEEELKIIKPTGGFVTFKNTGNVTTIVNADGFSGNLLYIMPGQAFYVRSKVNGGSVTFTENAKSFAASPMRLMSTNESKLLTSTFDTPFFNIISSSLKKELRINLRNTINTEEIVALFKNGGSAKADKDDAVLFGGSSVVLSTLSDDNVKLTINSMPEVSEVEELKLSVSATATGPVTLNFTDLSAVENYAVTLVDSYLNTNTDVRSAPNYNFLIDKAVPASFGNDRFKLVFKSYSAVSYFRAAKALKGVELNWEAPTVMTIDKFIIERSEDGINYSIVGQAAYSLSTKKYLFLDNSPLIGGNYYRLKQVDISGNETLSKPVFIDYSVEENLVFSIFPNPAADWINVELPKQNTSLVLSIYDLQGKHLRSRTILKGEAIKENINSFASGMYIIKILAESTLEILGTAKFLKY